MGGISGLIYSSLPVLVFVPVSSIFGLLPAIIAALAVAALILVWRLARKESVQPAISGFMGVGICALIAYLVGESKGYFLYGIWMSLVLGGGVPALGADPQARRGLHLELGQRARPRLAESAPGRSGVRHRDDHLGAGVRIALRRAAPSVRRRRDGMAGRRAHRDGLAADRCRGAGHLSGHPVGSASAARTCATGARRAEALPRPRTRCGKPSWPTRARAPTDR